MHFFTKVLYLFIVLVIISISFVFAQNVISDDKLKEEEQVLINMLDKGHGAGYEAYQTRFHLFQFAQMFFDAGNYDIAIAECDKIEKMFPEDTRQLLSTFRLKQNIYLLQGDIQTALVHLKKYESDPRHINFGTKCRIYLWLDTYTRENLSDYYLSKQKYNNAIEEYKKILSNDSIEAKECDPSLKDNPLFYLNVEHRGKLGDLYMFIGRYNDAAQCYNHAFDYLNTHSIPTTGFSKPRFERYKNKVLPELINASDIKKETKEISLIRDVDCKYKYLVIFKGNHYYEAADKIHQQIMEVLKNDNIEDISSEKKDYYLKLRDKELPEMGSLVYRANVDCWMENAEFNEAFMGNKEKSLEYYKKAKEYLDNHPGPKFISNEQKTYYEKLRTHDIPEAIDKLNQSK
jgi:tetratricopeptide (TPR) repeat protein